jgi:chaperone required for assembly of F1-ATPase
VSASGGHRRESRRFETGIAAHPGGFAVTVNGIPAKTPKGHPLVVPGAALAREIAREVAGVLAGDPAGLRGQGLKDPVRAANFRIAAGAIDVIAHEPGARARIVADLVGYGGTDLVCFRAARPDALVEAETRAWQPLVEWCEREFGRGLATTTGLGAPEHDPAALAAIARAVEAENEFPRAARSLAARAAGSIVIGLALIRGRLDAEGAFAAATVEEAYQAERWGNDAEAARAREARALDLGQAARFLELLAQAWGAPWPTNRN